MMLFGRRSRRRSGDLATRITDGEYNDGDNPVRMNNIESIDSSSGEGQIELANITNEIVVHILDSAQKKFDVKCDKSWSVRNFKIAGYVVHKVPPEKQRLISMGRLLQDDKTLEEQNITTEGQIIHLFPKPNVVITNNTESNQTSYVSPSTSPVTVPEGSEGTGGTVESTPSSVAHIPQIILNAEEAERGSEILVLSSHEAYETVHRVRLLSFLLLIYSSMQFLQDLTKWMGPAITNNESGTIPPGDPTDTSMSTYGGGNPAGSNGGDETLNLPWNDSDYFDWAINTFGVYVAMVGIKATAEYSVLSARWFLQTLMVLGIAWNIYYYYVQVKIEKLFRQSHQYNTDDPNEQNKGIYEDAMITMLLPIFLWVTFVIRAWQFQKLLVEAEVEAEERTRRWTQTTSTTEQTTTVPLDQARSDDFDLELQTEGRHRTET